MSPDEAGRRIQAAIAVMREDIARAKSWIVQAADSDTSGMVEQWLKVQGIVVPRTIDTDSPDCADLLTNIARAYSIRLAFYQAVWELISAGELISAAPPSHWEPTLAYKTPHYKGGIQFQIGMAFPEKIERLPFRSNEPADPDIFLKGIDCTTLHPGILEAIEQALSCFRRGLYMPATAMLAAAAEATWTECGTAIATKLNNAKLQGLVTDQYSSINKKVIETRKALEHADGKALLKSAGLSIGSVNDAETWTTTLRDRRNALHWSKAKSFIADHSGTAVLLMAAPLHIGTLEAIRAVC